MEYQNVAERRTTSKYSNNVKLQIAIGREFTQEEKYEFSKLVSELSRKLFKQSEVLDPEYQKELADEKDNILACFDGRQIYVKEIPNGYYPDMYQNPWFIVTTSKGPIKIGWRKRVINIDWSETDQKKLGRELFAGEKYTTGAYDYESVQYIHAASYEKAKEYIDKILS